MAQLVKNHPAGEGDTRDKRVRSLGPVDPLEKEMATCSSSLAGKIPCTEEPGGLQFMGSKRVDTMSN